jgi:hypothetical protein
VPGYTCDCSNNQDHCTPSLFCLVYTSDCKKSWPCGPG